MKLKISMPSSRLVAKPLLRALLASLIALSSAGCNTNAITRRLLGFQSLADIAATPVPTMPPEQADPTPQPTVSTAAAVKARGRIIVGLRYDAPPLASIDDNGELQGMDVDLAREFARRWLGDGSRVSFVQVTSLSAPRRVKQREVDLAMGGLSITRLSDRDVDYSLPYAEDGEALLVRTNSFPDMTAMAEKEVYYVDAQSLPSFNLAEQGAGVTISVKSEVSYANALLALTKGQTDGMIGRLRRLTLIAQRDPAYQVLTVFEREPQAIMLPQNDSGWADLVNITLSNMVIDGTYATIYQKWFGVQPAPITILPGAAQPTLEQLPPNLAPRQIYDQMRINGQMRVGYAMPAAPLAPLLQLDEGGQPIGLEPDLVREITRRLLQNGEGVQFFALQPDQIARQLAENRIDIAIGGFQRTQENERVMDFSGPTADGTLPQLNGKLNAPTGIVLATDDSGLRDAINFVVEDMRSDGTYEALRTKWLP